MGLMYARQLDALGDATRREIFDRIRHRPRAVGELAAELPVSRPAVSQHLRVLRQAGLVQAEALGTRRIYSVDPSGIDALRSWVEEMWDEALGRFASAVAADDDEKGDH
ncbi:MAG: metalloregulator ArsR/SmtB family transcription factor [Acidimicrobiia bacterium]|jgi:DNA-binding transcriptional ArsR family regulator